jgi:hypothetical protein
MQNPTRTARRAPGRLMLIALMILVGCASPVEPGPTVPPGAGKPEPVTQKVTQQRRAALERCQEPDLGLEEISLARCRIPDRVVIQ